MKSRKSDKASSPVDGRAISPALGEIKLEAEHRQSAIFFVGTCDRSTRTKCEHWLVTVVEFRLVTVERIARGKMEWKRFQRMFEGFYGGEKKYEEGKEGS